MKAMKVRKTINLPAELAGCIAALAVDLETTEQRLIRGILSRVLSEVPTNE